jgi:hypothetical protein
MHMNHLNSISISHNKHYKGAKLKNDKNIKPLVKLDAFYYYEIIIKFKVN